MSLFEKLFPKKKPSTEVAVAETPIKEEQMYPGYTVEHYPYSEMYFARHRGKLLKKDYFSGVVDHASWNELRFATGSRLEADAWHLVKLHHEQTSRATVKVLKTPTYLLKSKDGNTIDI